jgi:hypothetical protein
MKRNRRSILSAVAICAFLFASTAFVKQASAIDFDHFNCFKTKDTRFGFHPPVNLTAVNPFFPNETGCQFIGAHPKAKFVCTPVAKSPNFMGPGQNLHENYLCYNMKCPKRPADLSAIFTDQVGSGTVTAKAKSTFRLLCVPAPPVYGSPAKAFLSPTTSLLDD